MLEITSAAIYDASKVLRGLTDGASGKTAYQELWEQLHHQGDLGEASYASVPWLIEITRRSPLPDWNPLALVCTIELARPSNQEVPPELQEGYFKSLGSIPSVLADKPCAVWDDLFTQVASAALALSRGHRAFAEIYLEFEFGEAKKWLAGHFDVEESRLGLQNLLALSKTK